MNDTRIDIIIIERIDEDPGSSKYVWDAYNDSDYHLFAGAGPTVLACIKSLQKRLIKEGCE